MYAPLKPSMYTFQTMPWIEISEKDMKLLVWMNRNGSDDSTISLILLGENPENRIGIILVSKTIKVDYDQVRKELIELEVNGDGGDD